MCKEDRQEKEGGENGGGEERGNAGEVEEKEEEIFRERSREPYFLVTNNRNFN
jgi:hypothetical protein